MEFIQNNGSLFNGVMPIKVTPDFEKTWDYDTSVEKVKLVFAHWKKLTTEMIEELIRARNELSKPGNPFRKKTDGNSLGCFNYLSDSSERRPTPIINKQSAKVPCEDTQKPEVSEKYRANPRDGRSDWQM